MKILKARTALLVVIAFGLGVLVTNAQKETAKSKSTIYEGTFPCADCSGLKTELTLYRNAQTDAPETFRLRETYIGKPAGNRTSTGKWAILRGTPDNPDATVYQLNPDKPQEVTNFLVVNENQIRQLDRDQKEIQGANLTLTRRNSSAPGGYSEVSVSDPDTKAAAEFAVAEQGRRDRADLSLLEIIEAQKQVVAGLNYKICFRVRSGSTTRTAVAVIYKNLQQQYSLTSFQWGKCLM